MKNNLFLKNENNKWQQTWRLENIIKYVYIVFFGKICIHSYTHIFTYDIYVPKEKNVWYLLFF